MAIIRNNRSSRLSQDSQVEDNPEEIEIDYSWHPSEEEFTSPITADQWAELLGDASFAETDAARAVRCLHDYGEPATFQQLSIRYRGTMGRYRRWLNEAAKAAAERYGVPAPQKDQFGMDEWWPLLYRMRATGKPGAGVFEMELRIEVEQAYAKIEEKEKQAKRAENARQLQRIEQLERARKEERERRAAKIAQTQVEEYAEPVEETPEEPEPPTTPEPEPKPKSSVRTVAEVVGVDSVQQPRVATAVVKTVAQPVQKQEESASTLPAFSEYLEESVASLADTLDSIGSDDVSFDATGPVDYALRYADRLRNALELIRKGQPRVTAAAVARQLGDTSVRSLQDILNGEQIPDFDYVERISGGLFINPEYLEAVEDMESFIPVFCTFGELLDATGTVLDFAKDAPVQIAYVVEGSRKKRAGVILRFSALRCALASRVAINSRAKSELDKYARSEGIACTTHTISARTWNELMSGKLWPGTLA